MFNAPAMAIVLVFNLAMVMIIVFVGFKLREDPLITLGDAVASFLAKSDATTAHQCLADRSDFEHQRLSNHAEGTGHPMARQWSGLGSRWFKAIKTRFIIFFSLL